MSKPLPHMGFAKLVGKLKNKHVQNPAALAAYIGRKKYGAKTFQEMSAHGRQVASAKRKADYIKNENSNPKHEASEGKTVVAKEKKMGIPH